MTDSVSLNQCPRCGGPADNGHDRCLPPSPYFCAKCTAEIEKANGGQSGICLLNPDMPTQELRLHMGELTADEARVARAAIRWANTRHTVPVSGDAEVSNKDNNLVIRSIFERIKDWAEKGVEYVD